MIGLLQEEAGVRLQVRAGGSQKAPTRKLITLRLDERVIDHYRAQGDGWQLREMTGVHLAAAEVIQHIGARPQVPLKELAEKIGLPV